MSMGSFNPNYRYHQEDSGAQMGALVKLLQMKNEGMGKVGEAFNEFGRGQARNRASVLMGTDEYKDADRATAQAMLAKETGGRDLGENFLKTIAMSDDNKGDVQGENWKREDATTAYGRSNAQIDKRHANSVSLKNLGFRNSKELAGINNRASIKAANARAGNGNGSTTTLMGAKELATTKAKILGLENAIQNNDLDPAAENEAKKRLTELKVNYTRGASKKPSAVQNGWAMGIDKTGTMNDGSTPTGVKALIPGSKTDKFTKGQRSKLGKNTNLLLNNPKFNKLVNIGKDGIPRINGKVLTEQASKALLTRSKG